MRTDTHTYTRIHISPSARIYTHRHTRAHIHAHTHTYPHTHSICTQTYPRIPPDHTQVVLREPDHAAKTTDMRIAHQLLPKTVTQGAGLNKVWQYPAPSTELECRRVLDLWRGLPVKPWRSVQVCMCAHSVYVRHVGICIRTYAHGCKSA